MTSYDPDSLFTMSALSRLEGVGIPIMISLNSNIQLLQQVLSTFVPNADTIDDAASLLYACFFESVLKHLRFSPTWKNLLLIIRFLNLDELAEQMETYFGGVMEEYSPVRAKEGDKIILY